MFPAFNFLKYLLPFLCLSLLPYPLFCLSYLSFFFSIFVLAHFLISFLPPLVLLLLKYHLYILTYLLLSPYIYNQLSPTSFILAVVAQHIVGQNIEPCLTTSVISILSVLPIATSTTISVVLLVSYFYITFVLSYSFHLYQTIFQPNFVKSFFCIYDFLVFL